MSLERWRLILGQTADPEAAVPLSGDQAAMDRVLEALYDADRQGGLGRSSPNINRWLGDIRRYFPAPVVQLIQRDALERLGLTQLLLEPELLSAVEPDVHLVGALLALQKAMPAKTRETARIVVRHITDALERRIRNALQEAVKQALNRSARNRRPRLQEIDWRRTIHLNLKHYQPDLQAIIPERVVGFGRKGNAQRHIILLLDQSGSMAGSVVYAAVFGAVLATLRSVKTHLVVFDTAVVDMSEHLHDPVELLFGTQLGGGTDIYKALSYAQTLVQAPQDTILILISDLYEGGHRAELLRKAHALLEAGVRLIALLALSDEGAPGYDHENAAALASLGIPAFACTPAQFPELMAAAISRQDIRQWAGRAGLSLKS
ncbi:MAG: VWA domain-containing protein [Saprospirales bacterium]|nr:VWA domain-containing protein [Saprospirales bacterium]MBK8921429.1 VWA domain-containing protein [Saprospirales bacterium]